MYGYILWHIGPVHGEALMIMARDRHEILREMEKSDSYFLTFNSFDRLNIFCNSLLIAIYYVGPALLLA